MADFTAGPNSGSAGVPAGKYVNVAAAAISVALIGGVGVWGYKLLMRDVTGVPVVRAMEGEMRVSPENPGGDIEIEYSGLRPGEKLYEELLVGDDVEGTEHPRIMTANEVHLSWPETHNLLNRLDQACHEFKVETVIELLLEAPAAFNKQGDIPDWVLNQSKINNAD